MRTITRHNYRRICKVTFTSVTIPKHIRHIAPMTFHDCKWLTTVIIEGPLRSIGIGAFSSCTALTTIITNTQDTHINRLPNTLRHMGMLCFDNCKQLKNLAIPPLLKAITVACFDSCGLEELHIQSNTLMYIAADAFAYCTKLRRVYIDAPNLTSIGPYAFVYCTSLEEVTIPTSVEMLSVYTFWKCPLRRINTQCVERIGYCALPPTVQCNMESVKCMPVEMMAQATKLPNAPIQLTTSEASTDVDLETHIDLEEEGIDDHIAHTIHYVAPPIVRNVKVRKMRDGMLFSATRSRLFHADMVLESLHRGPPTD